MLKTIENKKHLPRYDDEPEQPCWARLSETFNQENPLFKNMLFLEGYDRCSNIYIIVGEYLTIVDPGYDHTVFEPLFQQPEYAPGDIQKVVLTHKPPDRPLGALELLRYPTVRSNPQLEFILHTHSPVEIKRVIRQLGVRLTEVKGSEILDLGGFDWKVVPPTAMRVNDGISMYHAATKTLISGDTLPLYPMAASGRQADEWTDQCLFGTRSLMDLEIANVLPRHGLPISSTGKTVLDSSY